MCGGGKPKLPLGLDQFVYALPYVLFGSGWLSPAIAYAGGVYGKRTGHGQYHGVYAPRQPPENDEWFDFIVRFFYGPDTGWDAARSTFGLILSGLLPVLAAALVALFVGHIAAAVILSISGALKGPVYVLSHYLKNKHGFKYGGTMGGEYGTGFAAWGAVAIIHTAGLA
jgi:hypothetical protein